MAGNDSTIHAALQRLLDAFNRHDLDAIMELFDEEATLDMPRGPHPWGQCFRGKAQVREGLAGRFKGPPDVHYGDDRHFVSGNMGFSEWTLTGTTPTGARIEVRRVGDINALRALAPLPRAPVPRPSRPQPRTPPPRWSRRHRRR